MVLTADAVNVAMDVEYRPRHAEATGEPVLRQMVSRGRVRSYGGQVYGGNIVGAICGKAGGGRRGEGKSQDN